MPYPDLRPGLDAAIHSMVRTINWRLGKAVERSELRGHTVARIENAIQDAVALARNGRQLEAVEKLTHAAILLGRNMFVEGY